MVLGIFTELCNCQNQFENVFIILLKKKSRASKAGGKRLLVLKAHALLGSREAGALPGSSSVGLLSCLECGQWQACDSGLVGAGRLRAVDYVQAWVLGPTGSLGRDSVHGGVLGSASPTPPALHSGPWPLPHLCAGWAEILAFLALPGWPAAQQRSWDKENKELFVLQGYKPSHVLRLTTFTLWSKILWKFSWVCRPTFVNQNNWKQVDIRTHCFQPDMSMSICGMAEIVVTREHRSLSWKGPANPVLAP